MSALLRPTVLGDRWWWKPVFAVEIAASVPDPRTEIKARADDQFEAIWLAERAGYRAYSAKQIGGAA